MTKKKWDRDESHFCLTSASDAFEIAHGLLKDGNNDRVTWILASRALTRGRNIANGLTEQVHKDVFEVELDRYRIIFGDILGRDNEGKDEAFFRGATFFQGAEVPNTSTSPLNIPPPTLKVIWDFAEYPLGYEDPVSIDDSFSVEEIDRGVNGVRYPGLFNYLKMLRRNGIRFIQGNPPTSQD